MSTLFSARSRSPSIPARHQVQAPRALPERRNVSLHPLSRCVPRRGQSPGLSVPPAARGGTISLSGFNPASDVIQSKASVVGGSVPRHLQFRRQRRHHHSHVPRWLASGCQRSQQDQLCVITKGLQTHPQSRHRSRAGRSGEDHSQSAQRTTQRSTASGRIRRRAGGGVIADLESLLSGVVFYER